VYYIILSFEVKEIFQTGLFSLYQSRAIHIIYFLYQHTTKAMLISSTLYHVQTTWYGTSCQGCALCFAPAPWYNVCRHYII